MSNLVFRNYDKKAIRTLLKEMGKERYECAIKDADLPGNPLSMDGFYIEFHPKKMDFVLYYTFPVGVTFKLLVVNGFWAIPDNGWVKKRVES